MTPTLESRWINGAQRWIIRRPALGIVDSVHAENSVAKDRYLEVMQEYQDRR